MPAEDELQGIRELQDMIAIAAELLAAFIAAAADGADLDPKLVNAAHYVCDDLGAWGMTLATIVQERGDWYEAQ